MDLKSLRENLQKHNQEHLLKFWDQLTDKQKQNLYDDLAAVDYKEVMQFFKVCTSENLNEKLDDRINPVPANLQGSIARTSISALKEYENEGLKQISENKVGVLLLAGGQGTRLGVSYPKGMYDVGLISGKTLYQLQAERIRKLEQLAYEATGKSGTIPWYIMTSEHTKDATEKFFNDHNYFGLDKSKIIIFEQHTLPCFTPDGKIFLETQYKIARAPDGNGGLYKALGTCHILEDMKKRGLHHIHVYCVDNILVKMADPLFIGFCIAKKANCGAKVVEKSYPTEAVGIVCQVDGKYQVVEYSEISQNTAEKRNPDGRLTFNAGNICNHYFSVDFLEDVVKYHETKLQHHISLKKIPHVDDNGIQVSPKKANGIKLEKFVFDVFPFSQAFAVWEVIREDEFSPLKNSDASDKDCPNTSRLSLYALHQRLVLEAGGQFVNEDGVPVPLMPSPARAPQGGHQSEEYYMKYDKPVICEISPLVSYAGEGLEDLVQKKKFIPPFVLKAKEEGSSQINCFKP